MSIQKAKQKRAVKGQTTHFLTEKRLWVILNALHILPDQRWGPWQLLHARKPGLFTFFVTKWKVVASFQEIWSSCQRLQNLSSKFYQVNRWLNIFKTIHFCITNICIIEPLKYGFSLKALRFLSLVDNYLKSQKSSKTKIYTKEQNF